MLKLLVCVDACIKVCIERIALAAHTMVWYAHAWGSFLGPTEAGIGDPSWALLKLIWGSYLLTLIEVYIGDPFLGPVDVLHP